MVKKGKILLFVTLILLLPTQLGKHFWPEWALVYGVRVDYLSPTLFLTDLVIGGLFLAGRVRLKIPLWVLVLVVVNVLMSYRPEVSVYKWVRVLEYYWLYRYVVHNRDWTIPWLGRVLPVTLLWTGVLTSWQVYRQQAGGGWWYWLGERAFSVSTPGVAKVFLPGIGMWVRPYATFPHPNVLAGFVLVAALVVNWWCQRRRQPPFWLGGLNVVVALTVLATLSRTAITAALFCGGYLLLTKTKIPRLVGVAAGLFSLWVVARLPGNPTSLVERWYLVRLALETIKSSPWWGVGWGAFIPAVSPLFRQPVHNAPLLVASETGIFLATALVIKAVRLLRSAVKRNLWITLMLAVVFFSALVDHYWISLHQPLLLLAIVLAVDHIELGKQYGPSHRGHLL